MSRLAAVVRDAHLAETMSAIFVTATGTDIGKTFVTAGLIRHWRAAGQAVDALKPVTTGFRCRRGRRQRRRTVAQGARAGRSRRRRSNASRPGDMPHRFRPTSPARREQRALPFDELVAFSRRAIEANIPARC